MYQFTDFRCTNIPISDVPIYQCLTLGQRVVVETDMLEAGEKKSWRNVRVVTFCAVINNYLTQRGVRPIESQLQYRC